MIYGSEAILPTDLEYGSPRAQAYDENSGKTFQEDVLDQLDEARDVALLHSAKYTPPIPRMTNPRPNLSSRRLGAEAQTKQQGSSQAHAPWEGPFVIAEILRSGTYKLANEAGEVFKIAWNREQLRRFYP